MRLRWLSATLAVLVLGGGGAATVAQLSRQSRPPTRIVTSQPPQPAPQPAPGPTTPPDPNGPFMPEAAPALPLPLDPDAPLPAASEPLLSPAAPAENRPGGAEPDPVENVEAFIHQNRQQAEATIKALNAEADQLKARLARVEAALARWHGVAAALKAGPRPGEAAEIPPPDLRVIEEVKDLPGPRDEGEAPAPRARSRRPAAEPVPAQPNDAAASPAEPSDPAPAPRRARAKPPAAPRPGTIIPAPSILDPPADPGVPTPTSTD